MAVLNNPRHEKFSQLVASGIKPSGAYVSVGYAEGGAPQSANKLLRRTNIRERVHEIQSLAAQSTAEEIAFDQKRVLNRLDALSKKAEEMGQFGVAVRAEELIGKHRGMFVDRQALQWNGDLSKVTDEQLVEVLQQLEQRVEAERKQLAAADIGGAVVIEVQPKSIES